MYENLKGKRLLVLGGTTASLDLVKNAKEMGVYTIVTDDRADGVAKEIADERAMVSTTDIEGLVKLVKEKNIDGAFCGPSEFNIRNLIRLCEAANLTCYTDMETWDNCANKDVFKNFCREYGVDCTPEYDITEDITDEELEKIDYPIIIKPVDSSSSIGVTVCKSKDEVRKAYKYAMDVSKCKRVICEKYIQNGGEIFQVRYMVKDGNSYPYSTGGSYVVSPEKKCLIHNFGTSPSRHTKYYMENMDEKVRKMLKGMGIKYGTVFIQSLPCDGKIYFHEMGYRLSGGMVYKITEPLYGVNDMKMMIAFALGGEIFDDEEMSKVDIRHPKKIAAMLSVPLNMGKIARIEGLEKIKEIPIVTNILQYYNEGDVIEERFFGTLAQLFARVTMLADSFDEIKDTVRKINEILCIYDENGNLMTDMKFDLVRLENN